MSDTQSEGRLCGEVTFDLLWAVGTGTRVGEGMSRRLGAALHGEGGLAPLVNVRIGAVVSGRSRALGEVLGGTADLSPGREAVAGPGWFVGNLAAHQKGKRVAADRKAGRDSAAGNRQPASAVSPTCLGPAPHPPCGTWYGPPWCRREPCAGRWQAGPFLGCRPPAPECGRSRLQV